ncbi:FAD-binding oxidoreductase [Qipengyuania sediminis]|uniref:FAD-binding oxidoreductase n=1 Tax=Qipengyuania sediminis TaxID=1532023 RepID=UPI0010599A5F|nr:FAD-binding oxidoreductase [Qipengyuania sediminis]
MNQRYEDDAFAREARKLLGARGFTTDAVTMAPWLTDWRGRYSGKARALASPASTREVSDLVALCARHGVPIVAQGGNSGMSGGATPDASGVALLLSLRRMTAIRRLDAAAGQAVCEAGVILETLHQAAAEVGLRFPLTLGGKGSATIGGLVATNAGGTQVLRHGTMRAQVLGLEAVLADGSVLDLLAPLKKDNRGFDLQQLFIGSEGTLGIVCAATLRLLPAIAARCTAWVGLKGLEEAERLLHAFECAAPDLLEGFEVLPDQALAAVLSHDRGTRAPLAGPHAWHALVELASPDGEQALDRIVEEVLAEAIERGWAADAAVAANERQAQAFWRLRDGISAAQRALGPAMQHDIAVPAGRMAAFVAAAVPEIERRFPGTRAIAFGHLGDGNVHFHVLAPPGGQRGAWEVGEGATISTYVHDLVTAWQGTISAEHGVGQMKRDELVRTADPVRLAVLASVKQALDPRGLLNPGKLIDPAALAPPPGSP